MDKLPTFRLRIHKTKQQQRKEACDLLKSANWVTTYGVDLGDPNPLIENEDDFDAHLTAAAVMRCVIERRSLTSQNWIDQIAEGSMLLVGAVDPTLKSQNLTTLIQHKKSSISSSMHDTDTRIDGHSTKTTNNIYSCPIHGCSKKFHGSRSGWDAHVASFRMHPHWHPDIKDGTERKRRFREEFPEWFI